MTASRCRPLADHGLHRRIGENQCILKVTISEVQNHYGIQLSHVHMSVMQWQWRISNGATWGPGLKAPSSRGLPNYEEFFLIRHDQLAARGPLF